MVWFQGHIYTPSVHVVGVEEAGEWTNLENQAGPTSHQVQQKESREMQILRRIPTVWH